MSAGFDPVWKCWMFVLKLEPLPFMSYSKYLITRRNLMPGIKTVLYPVWYGITSYINSWGIRKPNFDINWQCKQRKTTPSPSCFETGFIWSSENREKVNINSPFVFSCFLGGALSTLSRVLAFSYLPVEETDNSSLQRHSDWQQDLLEGQYDWQQFCPIQNSGSYSIFSITEKLHSVEIRR